MVLVAEIIFNIWKPRVVFVQKELQSETEQQMSCTLFLELLVSWCSVSRPPTTRSCWPFSKLTFRSIEEPKKKKKSMHGFEWRARQRRWSGLVCLGSGHCWGPALSSGGGKSAQVCPSIAECCVKVEGRRWSLPGEVVDCQ